MSLDPRNYTSSYLRIRVLSYITANQPRHLRTAQPGTLLHVTPQKTPRNLPLPGILLLNKHPLYPAVDLPPIMALKPDSRAGPDEPANLLQTQLLCFVHADVQSPACLPLQAHLVLESTPPFRLILYWTRLAWTRPAWTRLAVVYVQKSCYPPWEVLGCPLRLDPF